VTASWHEIEAEAADLVGSATEQGITVRVVGSTGIRMHCAQALTAMDDVERAAKDLDVVVRSGDRNRLRSLLEARGYVVDRDLLVAMEGQRFAFHHPERDLCLDVFVERLQFCHTIELGGRWERHATTIPIEDLLLQKLQVHELTDCDVIDAAVVLATHHVGPAGDQERIDRDYVAGVLAGDCGFHRDATANLDRVREAAGRQVPLSAERVRRVHDAAVALGEAIAQAHKSMAWRMRARVGERMQWWEDVNERVDTY
jgi:hypothetical protein